METKDRLVQVAIELFAERGFYGVSIADIAERLDISKQALLYHFGSKEKLYDTVLRQISTGSMSSLQKFSSVGKDPAESLESLFLVQFEHALEQPASARVILRELMDNRHRADAVQDWVLRPYLDGVADLVGRVPGLEGVPWATRFAFSYQIQGAIFYFMISIPTLNHMYGDRKFSGIKKAYSKTLKEQIHSFLDRL